MPSEITIILKIVAIGLALFMAALAVSTAYFVAIDILDRRRVKRAHRAARNVRRQLRADSLLRR